MQRFFLFIVATALLPVAAHAETIRLTPEQAEAAREAGATRRQRAIDLGLPDHAPADRGVHGEVGVAIGTGGYRALYGVAAVPLGNSGGLVLGYGETRGRVYAGDYGYRCRNGGNLLCRSQFDLDAFGGE